MFGVFCGSPSANGRRRFVLRVGSLFAVVAAIALGAAAPASGQLLSSPTWGNVAPVAPTSTSLVPVVQPVVPGLSATEAAAAVLIPCVQQGASLYRECQRALSVADDVCGSDTVGCVADKLNVTCSVPATPRSSAVAAPEYGPCVAAVLALANQALDTANDALRRPVVDLPDVTVPAPCSLLPSAATTAAASDPDVCVQEAMRLADAVLELTAGVMYMACEGAQAAQCATNKAAIVCGSLGATGTLSAQRDPDECVRQVMRIARDAQELAAGVAYTVCRGQSEANCAVGYVASACNVDLAATSSTAAAANDPDACVQRAQQIVTLVTDVLYGAIDIAYRTADTLSGVANGVVDTVCGGDQAAQCVQRELGEACRTAPTLATATTRNADRCVTLATGTALGLVDLANGVVYSVCGPDVAGCPLEKLTQTCQAAPALRAADPTVHPCVGRALAVADLAGELADDAVVTANRTAETAGQLAEDTLATVNGQLDASCRNVPTAATRDASADPVYHPCLQLALATATGVVNLVNGTLDAACGTSDRVKCAGDKLVQACRTVPAAKSDPAIPVHPCIDLVLSTAADATATVNREIDRACPGADAAGCANEALTNACALAPVALSSRAALDDPSYHPCIRTVLKIADATTAMIDGVVDSVCAGRDEVSCVNHELTKACTSTVTLAGTRAAADPVPVYHPCIEVALTAANNVITLVQNALGTATQAACGTQTPENCALNKVREACATPIHLTARAAAEPEPCVQLVSDTAFWAQRTADDAVRTACGGTNDPTVCANQKLAQACAPIHLTSRADAQTDPCVALVVNTARGVLDTVSGIIATACGTPDGVKCALDAVERTCGPNQIILSRSAMEGVEPPVYHPCIELALDTAGDALALVNRVVANPCGTLATPVCIPQVSCPVGGGALDVGCFERILKTPYCELGRPYGASCDQLLKLVADQDPKCSEVPKSSDPPACGIVLPPPVRDPVEVPGQWVGSVPAVRTVKAVAAAPAGIKRFHLRLPGRTETRDAGGAAVEAQDIHYGSHFLEEGPNKLSLTAEDNVGRRSLPQEWDLKLDRSDPEPGMFGELYYLRDEQLYEPEATVAFVSSDDYSGLARVELFVTPPGSVRRSVFVDDALCEVDQCPKVRQGNWTFRGADFPEGDGVYRFELVHTDMVGRVANVDWKVEVDLKGDIYEAETFDGAPADNPNRLSGEHAQISGTRNSRVQTIDHRLTQSLVTCTSDPTGCLESRHLDQTSGEMKITTGTTADDERVWVSTLLDPLGEDIGALVGTGSIQDGLLPGQAPPPAHGGQYQVYEKSEPVELDGEDTLNIERTLLEPLTRLPLRREVVLGGEVYSRQVISYVPRRLEMKELPGDFFGPQPEPDQTSDHDQLVGFTVAPLPELPKVTTVDMVDDSIAFREHFGFSTDLALIEKMAAGAMLDPKSTYRYGVPLTAAEVAEMDAREALSNARGIVDRFGAARSATYGGSYLDHKAGGLLYVGFTADAAAQVEALKREFPHPARLRPFTATFTLASLESTAARLDADSSTGLLLGRVPVGSIGIDEMQNRVVVGTPTLTTLVQPDLQSVYGPSVVARLAKLDLLATRKKGIVGGYALKIHKPELKPEDVGRHCTLGFEGVRQVQRRNPDGTAQPGKYDAEYYQTSAGHCLLPLDSSDAGLAKMGAGLVVSDRHGSVGRVAGAAFPREGGTKERTGPTDAFQILLKPEFRTSALRIKEGDGPAQLRSVVRKASADDEYDRPAKGRNGDTLCQMGMTTGKQICGTIRERGPFIANAISGKYRIEIGYLVDFGAKGCAGKKGDSGGPVYVSGGGNVAAAGLISASSTYEGDLVERCKYRLDGQTEELDGVRANWIVPIGHAMAKLPRPIKVSTPPHLNRPT